VEIREGRQPKEMKVQKTLCGDGSVTV